MTEGVRIETARLALEAVREEMAAALHDAVVRSLAELSPWMAWANEDLTEVEAWARDAARRMREGAERIFAVLVGDSPAGVVGIEKVDALHRRADLGYWLSSDHTGAGYMTEACAAAVDHAFTVMRLHRLELRAGLDNHASNRIALNLGFRPEGLARHGGAGVYGFYDCNLYGLLADDPRPRP